MTDLTLEQNQILNNLSHQPTDEMLACLNAAKKMQPFKISAYAGAGKTSTLFLISEVLGAQGKKGLYLAFNKAIAIEAKQKFNSSVKCQTFNSLAYANCPRALSSKVGNTKNFPKDLAVLYDLEYDHHEYSDNYLKEIRSRSEKKYSVIVEKGIKKHFSPQQKMQIINDAISQFCKSADQELLNKHFKCPDWLSGKDFDTVISDLMPIAKKRWADLISHDNNFNISHDVYVKYWALTNPVITGYDYIMTDETQDSDQLMCAFLENQKIPVFYVGDQNQSIYKFRGAVNAMQDINVPNIKLTKSFRFGQNIANFANYLLAILGEETPIQGNEELKSKVFLAHPENAHVDAILCRTNKGAFVELVRQQKLNPSRTFSILADVREIRSWLKAAEILISGGGKKVYHPELSFFSNWNEVIEYVELNKADSDFYFMVSLIDQFDRDFKNIFTILDSLNENTKGTDTVISTIHKSKGLEWDNVMISNDFDLKLMSDKFVGINNKNESLSEWRKENSDIYLENWDLINFPSQLQLTPVSQETTQGRFRKQEKLDKSMLNQRFRITDLCEEEIRLLYVAITRTRNNLYAANLAELFVLLGKLEENLE